MEDRALGGENMATKTYCDICEIEVDKSTFGESLDFCSDHGDDLRVWVKEQKLQHEKKRSVT